MFRSKPIGWITAGTLFCVAGVALACRLRDGKETMAEANAAACPAAGVETKNENPAQATTTTVSSKVQAGRRAFLTRR